MIRRQFKAKKFGRLVFKDENGFVICKAGINNNSQSHRDSVVRSTIGMIENGDFKPDEKDESKLGEIINSVRVDTTIERIYLGSMVIGHPQGR
jgi:hypothetical protein